jgi:hypothetical protein
VVRVWGRLTRRRRAETERLPGRIEQDPEHLWCGWNDQGKAGPAERRQPVLAVVCTRYGPPDVLKLAELDMPTPKRDGVRIKIRATAVTSSDGFVRGLWAAEP